MSPRALASSLAATATLAVAVVTLTAAPAAAQVVDINPVRVDVGGHPANSGFLVFIEGDTLLNLDESEGTIATGGNLAFETNYQVALGAGVFDTFTAPGDSDPTTLYVGGGIDWPSNSSVLQVLRGNTKVLDTSTYTALNTDSNQAQVNYRLVLPGAAYESTPAITGTNRQSPESIGTPVPTDLIDIPSAFATYRTLTTEIAACAPTIELTDANGTPLTSITPGQQSFVTLVPGETNVLQLSAADLANLSEITFRDQPTADTPLVVNITGSSFDGDLPNMPGVSGAQAPYMLWNFAGMSTVTVTGGDSLEGTLYAPNADLTWFPTANIEGNVIAANFTHGPPGRTVREVHDFPFATTITCGSAPVLAELTLIKEVVGGTAAPGDWTLGANGPVDVSGPSGSSAVTDVVVEPGDYELSESGPEGYAPGSWACEGGSLNGSTVTVPEGGDVTCRIVNTFVTPTPTPTCPTPTTAPGTPTPTSTAAPATGGGGGTLSASDPRCATLPATGPSASASLGLLGGLLLLGGLAALGLARRGGWRSHG